jgi:protein-tyrosine phosphatase
MSAGLILVVCTGNVCRSPYIERLLTAELADCGIEVASAGTHALVGEPMDEGSQRLLDRVGLSADGFVARQLTPEMAQSADLVLAATREHRSRVVRMAPRALRRTHAIADFADLVASAQFAPSEGSLVAQLAADGAARRGEVQVREPADADIVDPFRRGGEVFEQMAAQVAQVLPPIVETARRLAAVQ